MGRPLFWINFLSYLTFVVLLSLFLIAEREKLRLFYHVVIKSDELFKSRSAFSTGACFLIVIFICIHMIKELYQISIQKWRYLTHIANYVEWCCFLCTLCFLSPYLGRANIIFKGTKVMWPLGSIMILLSYTTLILFLRRFYHVGISLHLDQAH